MTKQTQITTTTQGRTTTPVRVYRIRHTQRPISGALDRFDPSGIK